MKKDIVKPKDYEIEAKAFNVAWSILKQYYNIEQSEEKEWDNLIHDVEVIYQLGKGTKCEKLCKEMALMIADHLNVVSKEHASTVQHV